MFPPILKNNTWEKLDFSTHQQYVNNILKLPGFTEAKSKHSQALQDTHKLFVDLLALSASVCEEGWGFPNQADSTLLFTHTVTQLQQSACRVQMAAEAMVKVGHVCLGC